MDQTITANKRAELLAEKEAILELLGEGKKAVASAFRAEQPRLYALAA